MSNQEIPGSDSEEPNKAAERPAGIHPVARLPEEWAAAMDALGERPFRAKQIFRWIHHRGELDASAMTDLSKPLRERLTAEGLVPPATEHLVHRAEDGTRKLVLSLRDGARIECVLIPMTKLSETDADADASADAEDGEDDGEGFDPGYSSGEPGSWGGAVTEPRTRVTLCISTQFGCAMGCHFCASGKAGLQRGLRAEEIVSQVQLARRYLEKDEILGNLVFMGMGEPLQHYDETARALRLLTHPDGIPMSPRRITVSTVGIVPGIKRLGQDFAGKLGLALSLHAPDDETRLKIMPITRKYPVKDLIRALKDYPLPRRRRITIEYTLIAGINDSADQARRLAQLLKELRVKINLIPMNPIPSSDLRPSSMAKAEAFQHILSDAGYSCFIRTRRGDDVSAACGQLALGEQVVPIRQRT